MKLIAFAAALAALAVLSACGTGRSSEPERRDDAASVVVPKAFEVKTAVGQEDVDGRLEYWKHTVFDRVSPESRRALRVQVQARLDLNTARDAELLKLPFGVAIDRRLEVAREIAFESACLRLIDGK